MYDPKIVDPMRKELTDLGIAELKTPEEVSAALEANQDVAMVVVNSVCGCAAGGLRPGIGMALKSEKKPARAYTVFAGQDKDATAKAREYFVGYPPSSPSIAFLKGKEIVGFIARHEIEGHSAEQIASKVTANFERLL